MEELSLTNRPACLPTRPFVCLSMSLSVSLSCMYVCLFVGDGQNNRKKLTEKVTEKSNKNGVDIDQMLLI